MKQIGGNLDVCTIFQRKKRNRYIENTNFNRIIGLFIPSNLSVATSSRSTTISKTNCEDDKGRCKITTKDGTVAESSGKATTISIITTPVVAGDVAFEPAVDIYAACGDTTFAQN